MKKCPSCSSIYEDALSECPSCKVIAARKAAQTFQLQATPTGTPASPYRYASFFERLVADLIDGLIALAIALPFLLIIDRGILGRDVNFFKPESPKGFSHIVIWGVVLYNLIYLVGKRGQSWGRHIKGIIVVGTDGEPIGVLRAFIRYIVAALVSGTTIIGYLWMIWDKRNQTWHDKLCRTFIIAVNKGR